MPQIIIPSSFNFTEKIVEEISTDIKPKPKGPTTDKICMKLIDHDQP